MLQDLEFVRATLVEQIGAELSSMAAIYTQACAQGIQSMIVSEGSCLAKIVLVPCKGCHPTVVLGLRAVSENGLRLPEYGL